MFIMKQAKLEEGSGNYSGVGNKPAYFLNIV